MSNFQLSPDEWVLWEWGLIKLNATIVFTWVTMAVLTMLSISVRRRLKLGDWNLDDSSDVSRLRDASSLSDGEGVADETKSRLRKIPPIQNLLEVLVQGIRDQIREVSHQDPSPYVPFIGTLFLFIAMASLLSIVPGYTSPTASLSTTAALATCVLVSVPFYGMARRGFRAYLTQYVQPTVIMLPFNIIGEVSRTLALAVRLYGNMMSGAVIAAVLLTFVPLFVPIALQLLGLLTGMIQAYIFAILAMVYIASATRVSTRDHRTDTKRQQVGHTP